MSARTRGSVALTQDTPAKVSGGSFRKRKTMIHLATGNVYLADNETTLGTPTNGWKVPTGVVISFYDIDDIWAVTTDASATLNVWDE
jgi:hypothetical protein